MSETGNGRAAPLARDTPVEISHFQLITEAEAAFYVVQNLAYALAAMIGELSEVPGTARHQALNSAETLSDALKEQLDTLHQTLNALHLGRG